jgi:GxxExxY protein
MLIHEDVTRSIIEAAIEVHRTLGPGLLESAYQACLCHELNLRGITFQREVELPVQYKGILLDCGYRLDFLVDNSVIVEIKCVETVLPVHEAQLITYLKLSKKRVGILINYQVELLKDGIVRRVV